MGRFYITLTVTVYTDSHAEAEAIADRLADAVEADGEVGDVEVTDVEQDRMYDTMHEEE